MTIHYNSLDKNENFYSEESNRNYTAEHGLIYYTLKLTWSYRNYDDNEKTDKLILNSYKKAGWTGNHSEKELKDLYNQVNEARRLIPKSEFNNDKHIWNA